MKRITSIVLALLMLLPLCACERNEKEELKDPVTFCYLRVQNPEALHHSSAGSVIATEKREGTGIQEDLTALLQLYLNGPASEELYSPFPRGTKLVSWERSDSTLTVILTNEFATLTGMDLTLACASLTMTCLSLTDAKSVQIQAESENLDGKTSIIMNRNDLVLTDGSYLTAETTEP